MFKFFELYIIVDRLIGSIGGDRLFRVLRVIIRLCLRWYEDINVLN